MKHLRRSRVASLALLGASLAAPIVVPLGCGSAQQPPAPSADAGPDVAEQLDAGSDAAIDVIDSGPACPNGQAPTADGGCEPTGLQGCAPIFVDPDGICRPSMARCAGQPGTIPSFDQGCVPVGIQGCAKEFLAADGLCHPTMAKCPAGTFAVPQMGCVPIDGPTGCGAPPWGDTPLPPDALYVDLTYANAGSDGSAAKPFKTIAAALATAPSGGTIALAAGDYHESLLLTKAVTLAGRCPSMVRITGPSPNLGAVRVSAASPVVLRGVEIGGAGPGVTVFSGASVALDHVHIRQATSTGVFVNGGATVTIVGSWIESTLPTAEMKFGRGVEVSSGGSLAINDSAIVSNHNVGIAIFGPMTTAELKNTLVEDTLPDVPTKLFGRGVNVVKGATVTLSSSAIVGNRDAGVFLFDSLTHVQISQCLIEGSLPDETTGERGDGLSVQSGASADLDGSALLENNFTGVLVSFAGSTLKTTRNLIARTQAPGVSRSGIGVVIEQGAHADLTGDTLYENHGLGVFSVFAGSTVVATGLLVERTLPVGSSGQDGAGIGSYLAGPFSMSSCAIVDNTVLAVGIGFGQATVSGCLMSGTKKGSFLDEDGGLHQDFGDGLLAVFGANVDVDHTRIEGVARAGMLFDQSQGSIAQCEMLGNRFGVVLQGMPRPTFDLAQSSLHDNAEKDVNMDGDLAVPNQQAALP